MRPLVVLSRDGQTRRESDAMGRADLIRTAGPVPTIGMAYRDHKIVDHFRWVGLTTLLGCMVADGAADFFFHLERCEEANL